MPFEQQDSNGRRKVSAIITNAAGTTVDPVAPIAGGLPTIDSSGEYEIVAASQTAQSIGDHGAAGDYISGILVIPASTSPGAVTLLDNAISIPLFVGGVSSVTSLTPFYIKLGAVSTSGAWKITTGAGVSCIAFGNFS